MLLEKEYTEKQKTKYKFDQWANLVQSKSKVAIRFLPVHKEIINFTFEKRRAVPNTNYTFTDYFVHQSDVDIKLTITIHRFNNVAQAHNCLFEKLLGCTSPDIPKDKDRGISLGDICYCFPRHLLKDDSIEEHVSFVRNNIVITIESVGRKNYHVGSIAKIIDEQIISQLI